MVIKVKDKFKSRYDENITISSDSMSICRRNETFDLSTNPAIISVNISPNKPGNVKWPKEILCKPKKPGLTVKGIKNCKVNPQTGAVTLDDPSNDSFELEISGSKEGQSPPSNTVSVGDDL